MTDRLTPNRYGTPPGPEEKLTTAERFARFVEDIGLPQVPEEPARLPAPPKTPQTSARDRARAFGDLLAEQLDAQAGPNPFGYIDEKTGRYGPPITD